jgi:luciferase family oxidoreductase group 1
MHAKDSDGCFRNGRATERRLLVKSVSDRCWPVPARWPLTLTDSFHSETDVKTVDSVSGVCTDRSATIPLMPTALKLSVLDQSPAVQERTQDHAIRESLALAKHCEALGYHRYWVSEHHNSASIVGTAPEVLMAAIAASTQRIRVGSAGVMLPHYSTLKVAEQFRVLEAIAPGRIDLGLGRAPGSDRLTAMALNPDPGAVENFPNQVYELGLWLRGEPLPPGHPFREIRAHPQGPTTPEIWILGSSDYGAQLAAHFGLPYAYAYFFTEGRGTEEALALYRRNYRPSDRHPEPLATVCVWALAADTEAEARHLLMTREHWRVGFERGLRTPLLSPQAAAAHPYTEADRSIIQRLRERAIVGTAEQVAAKLREIAAAFALGEIVINTWTYDPAARHRSYELIAQAIPQG